LRQSLLVPIALKITHQRLVNWKVRTVRPRGTRHQSTADCSENRNRRLVDCRGVLPRSLRSLPPLRVGANFHPSGVTPQDIDAAVNKGITFWLIISASVA